MRSVIRSVAVGATVLSVALLRSLTDGFDLHDESWFLQVVSRVRAGDVLYREVFFGATPLSVYLTAAVSRIVGVEIVAVKIATNVAFAVTAVLTERIARSEGVSAAGSAALVGALMVWARPFSNPPYTPIAMTLFVATLAACLHLGFAVPAASPWRRPAYLLVGACSGLSFAAKQNVGALALAAALGALAIVPGNGRLWQRAGWVLAGFVAAVLLVLMPVMVSGGSPALWEYGFAGKGTYVQLGGVGYLESLRDWLANVRDLPSPTAATNLAHGLVLMLPIAIGGLAWRHPAYLGVPGRILAVFSLAGVATAFPRWDRFHMAYAVPVLLVMPLVMLRPAWLFETRRRPLVACWSAAAILFLLAVAKPLEAFAGKSALRSSTLPHFSGALITDTREARLAESAQQLADAAGGRPTLILSMSAGFWYLASGLRNPTPFDIPAATSVGRSGVAMLLADLASGRVSQVCVDRDQFGNLALAAVASYVPRRLQNAGEAGPCTLYRTPGAAARFEADDDAHHR